MALEMFRNRTGRLTLIAREPVLPGSYAEVTTYRTTLRLVHPPGLIINKWPALVPDLDSLSESLRRTIVAVRDAKRSHLLEQYRRATGIEATGSRLASIEAQVMRPPICVGVSVGRPLIIKMPRGLSGEYDLGTIRQIDIRNIGQDPVTVR
jgi:hypothetical protein